MFDGLKEQFGFSPEKTVTSPSAKMDEEGIDIVPPLEPSPSPAPDSTSGQPGSKSAKIKKIDSFLWPRFHGGDVTVKKGVQDLMNATAIQWAGNENIFMQPVAVLTRQGYDSKPVDCGARRFRHAPIGPWIEPASNGLVGSAAWLVDKGIPLGGGTFGLTAIALGRGIELHKVVNYVGLIGRYFAAEHEDITWAPRMGFFAKGNDYKSGEKFYLNEAPVLVINCSLADWNAVVTWFVNSPLTKEGGDMAGMFKAVVVNEAGFAAIDPSFGPASGPFTFIDGSMLRSTVELIIYSPVVARSDWMGEDKPAVEALEDLFCGDGVALVQHTRCVPLDDDSGAVMKALLLVAMDKRTRVDEVIEALCATQAAGAWGTLIEIFGKEVTVKFFRGESEARMLLGMAEPSPTSGGRGGGGRGGGRGPGRSLTERFDAVDLTQFSKRAEMLEMKLDKIVGTIETSREHFDVRMNTAADEAKKTADIATMTASQLLLAESQIGALADQSERTSGQLQATSVQVDTMASTVNALILYSQEKERIDRGQRGLKSADGGGDDDLLLFEEKWCAVQRAVSVPGLQHMARAVHGAAIRMSLALFPGRVRLPSRT